MGTGLPAAHDHGQTDAAAARSETPRLQSGALNTEWRLWLDHVELDTEVGPCGGH